MGVAPDGGVLVLAGDDPVSKSSTIPSASETALADSQIPVLFPGNPQEILDLGFHAIAMSRFSGLWVGMKLVTNVADGFGTADVAPDRIVPVLPAGRGRRRPWHYEQGGLALPPRNLGDERDLVYGRLEAARAYIRGEPAQRGDRDRRRTPARRDRRRGQDVPRRRAGAARARGRRSRQRGLDPPRRPAPPARRDVAARARRACARSRAGSKRSSSSRRSGRSSSSSCATRSTTSPTAPASSASTTRRGRTLVPADGELTPDRIAPVLAARLGDRTHRARRCRGRASASRSSRTAARAGAGPGGGLPARAPYFCSGCPHNRSTLVPEGLGRRRRDRLPHDGRADRSQRRGR